MNNTTELDAVNACLRAVGEAPVSTIATSGVTEAAIAHDVLTATSREVQGEGLHCNTDYEYPLVPNQDKYILIPEDALEVDPTAYYEDYVWRGGKLYNRDKKTFEFDDTVKFDIVWFLPYEDLPQHVRNYVAVRASRKFQRDFLGSPSLNSMSAEDEHKALVNFERAEMRLQDKTMLDTSVPYEVLNRRI